MAIGQRARGLTSGSLEVLLQDLSKTCMTRDSSKALLALGQSLPPPSRPRASINNHFHLNSDSPSMTLSWGMKEPRLTSYIAGWLPSGHMTFCGWFTDEPHEPHERVPLG